MSDLAVTRVGGRQGRKALILAVASLVLFIGGGFTVGGPFFLLGAAVGLAAIALVVTTRRKGAGREAAIAVVLAAVPVIWFAAYWIVSAVS